MNSKLLTIGDAAKIIGVSVDTLRRWDKKNQLPAKRNKTNNYRYYHYKDIDKYLNSNLIAMVNNWLHKPIGQKPIESYYCPNSAIFLARLSKLEQELEKIEKVKSFFPLIVAITGEIGNNSFDHNLGSWPDTVGIFFGYNLKKGLIVLADRGQGILTTLKRVRPQLKNPSQALKTAFTEVVSGRAPENRGNGLKFVRQTVTTNNISLIFQTGNAELVLNKNNHNLTIKQAKLPFRGCLAMITF